VGIREDRVYHEECEVKNLLELRIPQGQPPVIKPGIDLFDPRIKTITVIEVSYPVESNMGGKEVDKRKLVLNFFKLFSFVILLCS
jgi:hypothetical protein